MHRIFFMVFFITYCSAHKSEPEYPGSMLSTAHLKNISTANMEQRKRLVDLPAIGGFHKTMQKIRGSRPTPTCTRLPRWSPTGVERGEIQRDWMWRASQTETVDREALIYTHHSHKSEGAEGPLHCSCESLQMTKWWRHIWVEHSSRKQRKTLAKAENSG